MGWHVVDNRRFDREVEISVPSPEARKQILVKMLKQLDVMVDSGSGSDNGSGSAKVEDTTEGNGKDKQIEQTQSAKTVSMADVDEIVRRTHGCVGADLQAVCRTASLLALERWHNERDNWSEQKESELPSKSKLDTESNLNLAFSQLPRLLPDDLMQAAKQTRPSALRSFFLEVPNVRWHDIGGQVCMYYMRDWYSGSKREE